MAAYCPKCRAKLYENALFCGSCGEKIPNVAMNTENQQVQPQYTQAVQQAQPEYLQQIQMTPPQNVYPSMTVQTDYDIDKNSALHKTFGLLMFLISVFQTVCLFFLPVMKFRISVFDSYINMPSFYKIAIKTKKGLEILKELEISIGDELETLISGVMVICVLWLIFMLFALFLYSHLKKPISGIFRK